MIWSRWSGAGNTFFIADEWTQPWKISKDQRSLMAKRICRAFPKAPTDGLLFLEKKEGFDFSWDFYNADGSGAEMCGNAARCATLYFCEKMKPQEKVKFLTPAGEITGKKISSGSVEVLMSRIQIAAPLRRSDFFVDTGVPHWVIEEVPTTDNACRLRTVPAPKGANVTFVSQASAAGCRAVTFERGVEDFTLACGTGAVAAGAYLSLRFGPGPFEIQMPGGLLKVENLRAGERPLMTGPAEKNFELDWREE